MRLLGRFEEIKDIRTIWPHEARDFTKWLAEEENLSILSEAIGIDIILEEVESSVGRFNVDLYATEDSTGRKIIIENQLEETNHDHLGKLITYASGKGAEIIVWVVKRSRDEHKQAIEWLNQHTDENIGFFLLEIQLWKIDDSMPAVKFNVIERPNDWAKAMKSMEGLTDTLAIQLEFWQEFCEYAYDIEAFSKKFTKRKAKPQHWYDLGTGGSRPHISLTVNTREKRIGASIYFRNDKELFEAYQTNKNNIEEALGMKLEWRVASKDCRIIALKKGNIKESQDSWNSYFDWYVEMSIKMLEVINKYS